MNTLYITTPDAYLSLDGENVVVLKEEVQLLRVPMHNLESIITFGYTGASPALMGACAKKGIAVSFCTAYGRFLAQVAGEQQGNVLLRRTQYRIADDNERSLKIARNMLIGKLYNSRWVINRAIRDHPQRVDVEKLKRVEGYIKNSIHQIQEAQDYETLMGVEGEAASRYFSVFDDLILQNKDSFYFRQRSRRPPLDNINALLSFIYTILSFDAASAASAVGLDPFVGFLHKDRPGRRSLALDLMEELRAPIADRFVLTIINKRQIDGSGFEQRENGSVYLKDDARKVVLNAWQENKHEVITHPFLNEKVERGLIPYVQALLLARCLRGDLDAYPPLLYK